MLKVSLWINYVAIILLSEFVYRRLGYFEGLGWLWIPVIVGVPFALFLCWIDSCLEKQRAELRKELIQQLQSEIQSQQPCEFLQESSSSGVQSLSEVFSSCHSSYPLRQSILDQIPTAEQYSVLRDILEECMFWSLRIFRHLWRRGPHTIICSFYSFSRFLLGEEKIS